ncbi:MAG: hypothetical protein ACLFVK_04260 [Dehalococcoidia bacterium]
MESAIVAIVCIALILFGALTIMDSTMSSMDTVWQASKASQTLAQDIARTDISTVSSNTTSSTNTTSVVETVVENNGETQLQDFDEWDVIVQYYDGTGEYLIKCLPYVESGLSSDEWTVEGIYMDASSGDSEVFEPGIFDPDEEMLIQMEVSPPVGANTTNLAKVSTPNGVFASATFTR